MKRAMIIVVVALLALGAGVVIGHRLGKKNAIKAMNGVPANGEAEEDAEATA